MWFRADAYTTYIQILMVAKDISLLEFINCEYTYFSDNDSDR